MSRERRTSSTARIAMVVVAAFLLLGLTCDEKESIFFELIGGGTVPDTGDITGRVTVDGSGRSGVTVSLRNSSGQVIATDVTDSNGNYGFLNVDPGSHTVAITPPSGTTCDANEKPATVVADQTTTVNFSCATPQPTTGTLIVTVSQSGTPIAGASVIADGPGGPRTGTTGANGTVTFTNVTPGQHIVTATSTGRSCSSTTAAVTAGQTTNATVPCTTVPGSVGGQVTLNGSGANGVAVRLMQGATVVAQTTTAGGGNYSFANVAPGSYTVEITPPSGATCDATSKPAAVTSGQNTVVNFACTTSGAGDFTVSLNTPPPGWNHDMPGVSSLECKVITTTPAQPGASYSVVTTGPAGDPVTGVVLQASPGTLNSSGSDDFQVRINKFGTYTNTVTVTSGTVVRMASTTVTVTAAANTCPAAASSQRFKFAVTSLLPDGMTLFGLRPVSFRYRTPYGDPGAPQIGLIAEEVARVYPGAIMLDAAARPEAIWYGALNGLVLEEIEARVGHAVGTGIARLAEALE